MYASFRLSQSRLVRIGPNRVDERSVLEIADLHLGLISATPNRPSSQERIHPISVCMVNRGSRPVRLIGMQQGCVNGFCCRFDIDGPIEIPAKGSIQVPGELKCFEGPFETELEVHYDNGALMSARYVVTGRGVNP